MPTALLSVYDKTGIVELAAALHELGWQRSSAAAAPPGDRRGRHAVTDVADLTGVPGDPRPPRRHAAPEGPRRPPRRSRPSPSTGPTWPSYGIEPIDLVVVNLYPFASDPSIELIDIGGPAMVRAAAKNHAFVGVVVDPADYAAVLDELRADGALVPTRPAAAWPATRSPTPPPTTPRSSPGSTTASTDRCAEPPLPTLHLVARRERQPLRYGENPHQAGARYRRRAAQRAGGTTPCSTAARRCSYLNLYDTEAAWRLVHRFDEPGRA